MIPRHQLAVAPRITRAALLKGGASLVSPNAGALEVLAADLGREFGASRCVLTDSGTSALILALRIMVGNGGTVALPGYGCVDITSAVRFAGIKATLYDVDPSTLSPDLDSVNRALQRGVQAILVAHYYGYPADVSAVRELAANWGVPVLEDAAQAAGGTLRDARLGSLGDLSVLSFGRGKGLFGGRGGALLAHSSPWAERMPMATSRDSRRGFADFAAAIAQWALGRPHLYAIPASLPGLHLGEMVYRPAHEPGPLSLAAASLVHWALANEAGERRSRVGKAAALRAIADDVVGLTAIRPISGGDSGYLRFVVLDRSGVRAAAPRLGVMQGYPRTLGEQPELAPALLAGQPATTGADELSRSLFTLPTHSAVTQSDLLDLQRWLGSIRAAQPKVDALDHTLPRDVAMPQGSR